ncbi:TIM-barrel domain-containing protein [Aestuariibacter salexigens]|uniref:glycoside hydrolase family 31 protein n=1 Tax=Aestuariibacter salexigens TaxID=226010 RepID=UPI00041CB693|nr:TIM-barrel domain-containing protein [Aestuariibacter salexigens]
MSFSSIRRYALLVVALVCLQTHAASYVSHQLTGQALVINTDEGRLTLTALHEGAMEAFYQSHNVKQIQSFARAGEPVSTDVSVQENDKALTFVAPELTAVINKSPLRIDYYQSGQLLLAEEVGLFVQDTVRGFRFRLDENEKLMGGGQRVLGMDRRGHRLPLYNRAHYGYTTESSQMYYSLSAVMSDKKYMLIFDNSANGFMDLGHTDPDVLQFEAVGGRTSYIVIAGQDYPKLIENYVRVTGKQPLPPRWALGNFASRFGYHSEQETRDTVQRFIDKDFPLDAVVLDLYWFGPDIKGHMGNLDWDIGAWPNPAGMMRDLREKGVKTVVITEPFILSNAKTWQSAVDAGALAKDHAGKPRRFDFYFGNTGLVDVFDERANDWFWSFYQRLAEQGVAGWWGDLGEPEVHPADSLHTLDGVTVTGDEIHNAYGHKWAQMVYERTLAMQPDARPFVMMRSGFVGSQRYGMIPWTGDVDRSWGGLKPQVELGLQMSLFGLAYTHSDLGGFAGGEVFDPELYIRWLQFGAFQPVFRPHAQEHIAPEPVFHDASVQDIVRRYIKLRYALMPYHYSLSMQNSLSGMPLMRPLFFEDENNPELLAEKQAFLWGDAFLVKPVTEQAATEVSMPLPGGVWFDYWTGERYQGTQAVTVAAPLERLPVLVRAGSFIPSIAPTQHLDDYSTRELTVTYYHDESVSRAEYTMLEDDGKTPDTLAEGKFETLSMGATATDSELILSFNREGRYQGSPDVRKLTLVIQNLAQQPGAITINGQVMSSVQRQTAWDSQSGTLRITTSWTDSLTVSVK